MTPLVSPTVSFPDGRHVLHRQFGCVHRPDSMLSCLSNSSATLEGGRPRRRSRPLRSSSWAGMIWQMGLFLRLSNLAFGPLLRSVSQSLVY